LNEFSVSLAITKCFKFLQVLFEVTSCTVVFQFAPENHNNDERVPDYFDKLNSWVKISNLLANQYLIFEIS